jgi:beta-lactamase regulating signal transducer with metallopeptidase domain
MNSLIETLNQWSAGLPGLAWQMFWQSSLLMAAVFTLDLALRRKVRAAVRYALWLVVLLKLVIPPTLAAPTSVAWWVRSPQPTQPITQAKHYVVSYSNSQRTEPSAEVISIFTGGAMQRPVLSWAGWALLVSGAFSIGLLTWAIFRWRHVARIVRDASPANESLTRLLDEAGRSSGVRRSVQLLLTDQPMSPAVCGLSRPVVLLPRSLSEQLPPNRLRAVLLHELTHLKRGDVWVNCLQTLLQIVYWWHPLVWLANARIRRVREEAVDDAVMLALRDDADCYAPTLLEVAKLAFHRPLASLGLVGILESRSALRQRIERLVKFTAPRSAGLSLVSILGIAAFTALAVPMGEAPAHTKEIAQLGSRAPQVVVTNNAWAHANGFDWHVGNIIMASPVSTNDPTFVFETESVSSMASSNGTLIDRRFNLDMKKLLTALRLATNNLTDAFWPNDFHSRFLEYFKSRGVDLRPPTGLFFHADGRIWFRATAEDLDRIEAIIVTNSLSKPIASVVPMRVGESSEKIDAATLIQDGRLLFELGKYYEAETAFTKVMEVEPQNATASYYLSLVQKARHRQELHGSNRNSINDLVFRRTNLVSTANGRQAIMKKLDQIRLDRVSYDGLPLSQVVRNLSEDVKRRDPENRGINFLINTDQPVTPSATVDLNTGLGSFSASDSINDLLITIHPAISDIRVADALDAIVVVAENRIKYAIMDDGIVFSARSGDQSPPLASRSFRVDPNTFMQTIERETGIDFSSATTAIPHIDVNGNRFVAGTAETNSMRRLQSAFIAFLRARGVDLSPPKSFFYGDRHGTLLVRATAEDLDTIEAAIKTLNVAPPPQVNIRVKFIEMPIELANTLPIGWTNSFSPGITGAPRLISILTSPQVRELIQELQKKNGVAALSDGQVTTLSGRQVQFQVADPQREAVMRLLNTNHATLTNTLPTKPTLDVIPSVAADGYTIQMTLIPTLPEFLGYDDPGQLVIQAQGTNGPLTAVLPLPHFRLRQVATSAIVWDGQTVVLGGLIPMQTTNQSPVILNLPGVAKLFPDGHEQALLIFVTPTIIDPAGNRVHTDEELNALPGIKR